MHLTARRLRLGSGLVLLTYVTLHMINHTLGLWSLDLAEAGLSVAMMLWQSVPGTILLYGAAALHFAIALRTVYGRRSWQLPPIEWLRLWAGFSLPWLLIAHAVATRVAASFYGVAPSYHRVVGNIIANGTHGWQLAVLAPGWLHGCLGLWISLRRYPAIYRARRLLIGVVILVPLLSALGFAEMVRTVGGGQPTSLPTDPALIARGAALLLWGRVLTAIYLAVIAAVFLAGFVRNRIDRHHA
jgi:adenylate cyclase